MLGKCIVTTIVRRYRHDGSCSITSQYIITNPYRNRFSCKRIYCIRTTKHTRYTTVCNTLTFCTLLCTVQISLNFCTLCFGCQHRHQFTFRCKYHERHTEHRIGTRSKDSKFQIAVFYLETYFSTFWTANPVTLSLFQRICPVYRFQSVKQTLCISRHTQTPLAHLFLYHRMSTTFRYPVYNFIVCQYRTQCRTPVYHGLS